MTKRGRKKGEKIGTKETTAKKSAAQEYLEHRELDTDLRDRLIADSTLANDSAKKQIATSVMLLCSQRRHLMALVQSGLANTDDHRILSGVCEKIRRDLRSLGLLEQHIETDDDDDL